MAVRRDDAAGIAKVAGAMGHANRDRTCERHVRLFGQQALAGEVDRNK